MPVATRMLDHYPGNINGNINPGGGETLASFNGGDCLLKTEPIYDEKWNRRGQHQDYESQGPGAPPGL